MLSAGRAGGGRSSRRRRPGHAAGPGEAAARRGAELAAQGGAAGDEGDGRPVEVGDEEEEDGGDRVDDGDEDALDGVEPLERLVEEQSHQGDVDDPLGGGEVAAVDAGECQPGEQRPPAVPLHGPVRGPALPHLAADQRLEGDEDEGQPDQTGHDRLERLGGQGEQEDRAGDPAERGADGQFADAAALPGELAAVPDGPADGAGHEAEGVGHGGGEGRQPGGEQHGERDEGAGPHDGVQGPGPDPGAEHPEHLERGHATPRAGCVGRWWSQGAVGSLMRAR